MHDTPRGLRCSALTAIGIVAAAVSCNDGPKTGGQTGSEIQCESNSDCEDALGAGYECGEAGVCVSIEPPASCPETCAEFCTMAVDCTLPEGCENPGCLCPEADCSPDETVCPTTCGEFCPMAVDCTLPEGCENPGCGCPEADCSGDPTACPTSCAEFCPIALQCTLPDGCENPGCECPEAEC